MTARRVLAHLLMPAWRGRRLFPPTTLARIEAAIGQGEASHSGQLRFALESSLELGPLLRGEGARERGLEVFSALGVWDTEQNNGVLIYLLLADHDVEIIADRGIAARVSTEEWAAICRRMEACFRAGRFEEGALLGIAEVSAHLARHFPPGASRRNELPDAPALL